MPHEKDLRAFGPLVWLEVVRFDGKAEFWDFAPNPNKIRPADRRFMPRVAYDERTFQLWIVGGSFRVDGKGFRRVRGGSCGRYPLRGVDIDAARSRRAQERAVADYREHHGGLDPVEAVEGALVYPNRVVCVGRCRAAAYETDRNNGKGLTNYRHHMAEEEPRKVQFESMPFVDVSETGCRLFWRGGTMRVEDGWMID